MKTLIAGPVGQRESFEELVCQIGRRLPPHPKAEFRRIHGAGGDGGVEAVWVLPDGSEHGFQAKHYIKSAEVDWSAIDNSVFTALKTHPKLSKFYIAIACELTGPVQGKRGRGRPSKSGWEQWEAHKKKWEAEATCEGIDIEFVPWTNPDLDELLSRAPMVGLREYWLGEIELGPTWLRRQLQRTIDSLEERYHPEDHVAVSSSATFAGLMRSSAWREELKAKHSALHDLKLRSKSVQGEGDEPVDALASIRNAMEEFERRHSDIDLTVGQPFPTSEWLSANDQILTLRYEANEVLRKDASRLAEEFEKKTKGRAKASSRSPLDRREHDYELHELSQIYGRVRDLDYLLRSKAKAADDTRFLFIDGRAGSGKSHFLASELERALAAGSPCVFLLGTDFTAHSTIEAQILARLDIGNVDFERFLGAMNAAAELHGQRALIVIDAVNEGAGAPLWRNNLFAFAERVRRYDNLALCLSCRTEFVDFLLSDKAAKIATQATILGFETEDEREEAARVFMDRRGIVRPATPWLDPEFTNPLFLRTTCLALEREGRSHFPRGLRGTRETLGFYTESAARFLGTEYDGSDELISPTRQAILGLASNMSSRRKDYVERQDAAAIVDEAFVGFALPSGRTWLEVLRLRGILRGDPHPEVDPTDPMALLSEVFRFSFQRFQDHLMVEALLNSAQNADHLFDADGPFTFILSKYGIEWQWHGLLNALYIQVADKFDRELVDCLPGGFDSWWDDNAIEDAFVESVRWRSTTAFSDRSLELLNRVQRHTDDLLRLLIEVSIITEHPWNGQLLHKNLIRQKLAKRDAFWTVNINHASEDIGHPICRLTDWAFGTGPTRADKKTLHLAALVLSWVFTSTSGILRDRATKALSRLFELDAKCLPYLLEAFTECDDPYVHERIWAAAYGACLRNPDLDLLRLSAKEAYHALFKAGPVPPNFLLRDYGRGIIDLAERFEVLPSNVDITKCHPPYDSKVVRLNVSEGRLEARSKRIGADSILSSCYKGLADFGRYVVEGDVSRFSKAPLTGPAPLMSEEQCDQFKRDEIDGNPKLEFLFENVASTYREKRTTFKHDNDSFQAITPEDDLVRIEVAERLLNRCLAPNSYKRFMREARPFLSNQRSHDWVLPNGKEGQTINEHACKLWIANRAISYGWTDKLFPRDISGGEDRVRGSKIERIGKKYQRLAFSELLACLTDHYWLAPDWGERAKPYDNPLDISYTRDIEVSLLPTDQKDALEPAVPSLTVEEKIPLEITDWVFEEGIPERKLGLALGSDIVGDDWHTLYRYASCDINFEQKNAVFETPWKQSEFHFMSLVLMKVEDRDRLIDIGPRLGLDFHDWLPSDLTDGPYIGELGMRETWGDPGWVDLETRNAQREIFNCLRPAVGFQWESHLDGSLPEGCSMHLPTPIVLSALDLKPDPSCLGRFLNSAGEPAIISGRKSRNDYLLIQREQLSKLAQMYALVPVWTMIGERMGWPEQSRTQNGLVTRFNGMLWLEGGTMKTSVWSKNSR